jgi:hypothetical protein
MCHTQSPTIRAQRRSYDLSLDGKQRPAGGFSEPLTSGSWGFVCAGQLTGKVKP